MATGRKPAPKVPARSARQLPAVGKVLTDPRVRALEERLGHTVTVRVVREAIDTRQTTQKAQEKWRDERLKLAAVYEQLQEEKQRMQARKDRLQKEITAAKERIALKEKQLDDIEQISIQIDPFLQGLVGRLGQLVSGDMPFLMTEREQRISRLTHLMRDPEVMVSEKFRKAMEALLVEAEYGSTIEDSLTMGVLGGGLVGSAPLGPCYDVGGLNAALGQFCRDAADFLDGPGDQGRIFRRIRKVFGGGAAFSRLRMAPIIAKASITSETWRCQPCQEHVSLWSRPSSFLAVSKLSSIAQRCPSTLTSVSMAVPFGHHVEKNARSASAIVRRISKPRVQIPVEASL